MCGGRHVLCVGVGVGMFSMQESVCFLFGCRHVFVFEGRHVFYSGVGVFSMRG